MASVVVVLPTYNEVENVEATVRAVLDRPATPDVVVVDDNSPDGTAAVVELLARELAPRVRLHSRAVKEGLGRAYTDGFSYVLTSWRHDVVVQMDVDGSHAPDDLDRLVDATGGADLVLGSRYVEDGRVVGWPRRREWLSRSGNTYARLVLGVPFRDLTGGFKAWRAELLEQVVRQRIDNVGYGFQIEMTMRALAASATVVEVPITFRDRTLGISKMSGAIALEAFRSVPAMRGLQPGRGPRP